MSTRKDMRVVYLIGNGFDLKLGLKTSYSDFYRVYLKEQSKIESVDKLKKILLRETKNTKNWSDLELSLGKYLSEVSTTNEFDALFDDIQINLSNYLKDIQKEFRDRISILTQEQRKAIHAAFTNHVLTPERFLENRDTRELLKLYSNVKSIPYQFHIINFNYTNTIESILGIGNESNQHTKLNIRNIIEGKDRVLQSLYHVHGSTSVNMVLGVNDIDQIHNRKFKDDPDITNQFIKPECNLIQKHGIELECQNTLKSCELICIFGSSLGETDEVWWELIADQVRNRECRLVIFEYNENISRLNPVRGERIKRATINRIFGNDKPESIDKLVFMKFNSNIFDLQKFYKNVNIENQTKNPLRETEI